jgi:hypothetical protein
MPGSRRHQNARKVAVPHSQYWTIAEPRVNAGNGLLPEAPLRRIARSRAAGIHERSLLILAACATSDLMRNRIYAMVGSHTSLCSCPDVAYDWAPSASHSLYAWRGVGISSVLWTGYAAYLRHIGLAPIASGVIGAKTAGSCLQRYSGEPGPVLLDIRCGGFEESIFTY